MVTAQPLGFVGVGLAQAASSGSWRKVLLGAFVLNALWLGRGVIDPGFRNLDVTGIVYNARLLLRRQAAVPRLGGGEAAGRVRAAGAGAVAAGAARRVGAGRGLGHA